MTVQKKLLESAQQLHPISSSPDLDAELLLAYTLRKPREFLFTHPEHVMNKAQQLRFSRLLKRRLNREPIAYLLGHKEFFGLNLKVNPAVLIPRPETELVVEEVIRQIRPKVMGQKKGIHILDIGVGSGAIALAIKKNIPSTQVYGTDTSRAALKVAKENARQLHLKVNLRYGQFTLPFPQKKFDCIVSNPPYLTTREMKNPDLAYEPASALLGGRAGLEVYAELLKKSVHQLSPDGVIVLEIGATQATPLRKMIQKTLPGAQVRVKKDMAGKDRILFIQRMDRSGMEG